MALQEAGLILKAEGSTDFIRSLTQSDSAAQQFFRSLQDGGQYASAFSEVTTGALRRVGEVAIDALGHATQAIVGGIKQSIDVAAEYEASLNSFAAVTGESLSQAGMELGEFSDLFLEMGAKTQFSAGQAAQAAIELAKGGLDPATIAAGGLEAALGLAAAGELGLAQSSEILAKQLGVWASEGLKASEAADLLAAGANSSVVNVDDLAVGLANVGGVAKVAGLSFEETVTTMAQISSSFSSASDAGTSLKSFLNNLQPTTKSATEAMIALGLATEDGTSKFYDAQGAFIGMESASQLLYEATKDLSEADKSLALETIFGADAQRAAAAIAEKGAEGYRKQADAMEAAGGAAAQAAARNKGFAFAMETLRGSVETLQIVIGTALLPVLTDLLDNYVTPGVNAFMTFAQSILSAEKPMDALANVIESVLPGFKAFMASLSNLGTGKIIPALQSLAATLQNTLAPVFEFLAQNTMPALTTAIDFVSANFEAFAGALMGVGAIIIGPAVVGAITALLSALGLILTTIAPVIAIAAVLGAAWNTNFLGIRDVVLGALNAIITAFSPVITAFQQFGAGAIQEIIAFVTGAGTEFANLQALLSAVGAAISAAFASFVAYIQANLPLWISTLQSYAMAAWQWIQQAAPIALATLGSLLTQLISYLGANLPTWIANLLMWGTEIVKWIADAIPPLITNLGAFFATLYEWAIGTFLPMLVSTAIQWGIALYKWVADEAIPKIGPALMDYLKEALKAMQKILEAMVKAAKDVGEGIIDGMVDAIKSGLSSVVGAIMDVVNRAIQAAKDALGISSPSRVFADMGRDTVGGFNEGAESANVTTSISNLFNGIISLATSILPQWISTLMRWGEAAWNWVVQAIPLTMAHLNAWATQILFFTTGKLPEWMAILLLWGNEAWEWLRDAIPQLQIQLLAYWTALLTWSQGSMLPMLQEQGRIWGETLYLWIPQTLIPGIQPHWTAFLVNSLVRLTQIQIQFGKKGQDLGNAIIDGMVDAIKDGQSSVVSAIISTVVAAIRAAKEALGIASPSAVFMTIGADTMQGLSLGIREETSTAVGVIVGAIDRMIKSVPATLGTGTIAPPMSGGQIAQNSIINNSMTRTLNYSPTYNTAPPQIVDIAIASAMMGA